MTGLSSRTAMKILIGALVIAVAHAAARLTWTLAGETGAQVPQIAAALSASAPPVKVDVAPILKLAPFGSSAVAAIPQPTVMETSLGLVLTGVFLADPGPNSVAFIASADGQPKVYGVGETVDGKATIRQIKSDSVVLDVSGRVETLSFPKPNSNAAVNNIVASISNPGIVANAPGQASSNRPDVEQFRTRLLQNPKSVLDGFGLIPTTNGYKLEQGASQNLLRSGLRPGDLIAKVNGQAVGDIERDRHLVDAVIASGRVNVEVVRDGRTVVLSFPLK